MLNSIFMFEDKIPPQNGILLLTAIANKQHPEIIAKITGIIFIYYNHLLDSNRLLKCLLVIVLQTDLA